MPKRKQPDPDLDTIFAKLYAGANNDETIMGFLKKQKTELASANEEVHKTAGTVTFEDAVHYFNLTYSPAFADAETFLWRIETLQEVKPIQPLQSFASLLSNYTTFYDRSSEAACRVAVDLVICYCLGEVTGRNGDEVEPNRPPKQEWKNVKVYCEISFTHAINNHSALSERIVVSGRVDHGVGITLWSSNKPNRLFHSLLLCVEAKVKGNIESAFGQLVLYLASLHQSRVNRGKHDSSVYGFATDGLKYVFVTITNARKLLLSKQFDVMAGDLPVILGCLRYILEQAISMSPNVSPKTGVLPIEKMDGMDADEVFDVTNTPYRSVDDESDAE